MTTFGQRLRVLMDARDVSITALATTTGLNRPYLSRLVRGIHAPGVEIAIQIARGLGVSLAEFDDCYSPAGARELVVVDDDWIEIGDE